MSDKPSSGEKLIATNPQAKANFILEEVVEAGLILTGTEIKSLRAQTPNLRDSFVEIMPTHQTRNLEAWLLNCHIPPYSHGNIWNHDPLRKRKLLLHAHQINQLYGALTRDGKTIIPTRMYFKKGRAKIELALAKGKHKGDKRQNLKKKSAEREMSQALKQKQRKNG